MQAVPKSIRANWIDLFKAIAMIAVVVDHSRGFHLYSNRMVVDFVYFSVTLFIFLAGVTSALSISRKARLDLRYYWTRLRAILVPYAAATLIYQLSSFDGSFSLAAYVQKLIRFSGSPPFYFVAFFIQLVLISGVLYFLLAHRQTWFQLVVLILISIGSILLNRYAVISSLYGGGGVLLGGSYLFVFVLGMIFFLHLDRLNKKIAQMLMFGTSASLMAVFLLVQAFRLMPTNPPNVYLIIYTLCLFGIIYPIYKVIERHALVQKIEVPVLIVGKYSLYIFLYHFLFMKLGMEWSSLLGFRDNMWLYRPWELIMAFIPPLLIGYLFETFLPKMTDPILSRIGSFALSLTARKEPQPEASIKEND